MVPEALDLRGARLRLVPLSEAHLPAVQRWRSDPEVTRYWITRDVPSMNDLSGWLERNRTSGSLTLCIEERAGEPVGYADVFDVSREHRHCEIALMIGERSRWGQGYAREALNLLLGHLFATEIGGGLGMHKVSLAVAARNKAARRVYEACGFREDGRLREDLYYDGEWLDQVLMSVLEREFTPDRAGNEAGA